LRSFSSVFTALLLVAMAALQVTAETEVKVSGQVRFRVEIDGKSFDAANTTKAYELMRTRINVDALVDNNAHAFVQFQDSRILGGSDQFGNWQSGDLNDGKNVDIHQAYLQIDRLWFDGLGVKVGRFEYTFGNHRVFGNVGWSNVGRSWEGGLGWYRGENVRFSAFWLKAQEEQEASSALANRDFDIFGVHTKIDKANLELFGIYELDSDTLYRDSDSTVLVGNKLDRLTFGLHYHRQHQQFDFELNGAYQLGNMADTVDIAAMMFTGEVGYTLEGDRKIRFAAGIDYTSGDDDPGDLDHKAYNNLYYTGHKFRGHMDYFLGSGSAGLIDMIFRGRFNPHPQWTFKGDFHYFKTAQDYSIPADNSGAMALTSDVGMEFDFSLSTSSVAGARLVGGVSIFLPQQNYVTRHFYDLTDDADTPTVRAIKTLNRTNDDPTVWSYVQTIIDF